MFCCSIEILVAEETTLDGKDRIPPMAVDYPLRLYSTLESGRFAIQGIERSVCDRPFWSRIGLNRET